MAKNEIIDLAPKVEKITDEQLKAVQELVAQINQAQMSIGQLETQKAGVLAAVGDLQMKMNTMQKKLEEEYGKVSINIQDGSIKKEDESDTKD
jgi:uncharacterized protein involved in outer membrane biogenesis